MNENFLMSEATIIAKIDPHVFINAMNDALGYDSVLVGLYWAEQNLD